MLKTFMSAATLNCVEQDINTTSSRYLQAGREGGGGGGVANSQTIRVYISAKAYTKEIITLV